MKSEMTKNERSALVASYDVNGVHVDIDIDFVKSYLVRGNAENITDQELVFFLNTCKSQKLNPLVQGEVYLIKFGTTPAQMVVGKDAYLRRAYDNPNYLDSEDGIIIKRGEEIISKPGCCLYPGERTAEQEKHHQCGLPHKSSNRYSVGRPDRTPCCSQSGAKSAR